VESWLPDYALQGALDEFRRGGYKRLVAAAAGLPGEWSGQSRYKTGAELTAATLAALGLETNLIAVMPASDAARDRTYSAALGVKAWLETSNAAVRSVNLYSLGPHSRRSWLLYQKAFGNGLRIPRGGRSRIGPLSPIIGALGSLAPSDGERVGVRGLPGERGFMERVSPTVAFTPNPSPIGWERVAAGRVRVGVLAHPDDRYDPKRWWASSAGFEQVLSEGIAYLYARILFHPPSTGRQDNETTDHGPLTSDL
jgi:hypothetical protein